MKYIKLFEAFDSNKLNKIIAWKKVSANDKNRMLDLVKNIAKINDLPESKLSDGYYEDIISGLTMLSTIIKKKHSLNK